MKGNRYATGALCALAGGSGLAEISTSNHGCFWLCAVIFTIGISTCLFEIIRGEKRKQ